MTVLPAMPKYEAYKDSGFEWLGKVPNHWVLLRLKDVITEHSGNGFPIEQQGSSNGDIPFLKVSDISGSGAYVNTSANYVSKHVVKNKKWNIVPSGSLVTAKIGEALRKNHRKLTSVDSIIDNNCIGFEAINICPIYNFYLHRVIDFDWFVNPGAVPSISVPKYKSFHIVLPTKQEQTTIANFLDKKTAQIDEAIAIKQKQIELLKERKQIIIQKAVTQGLDPNVPLRDSGVDWIGQIPEHWDVKRLKYVLEERNERSKTGEEPLFMMSQVHGLVVRSEYHDKAEVAASNVDNKIVHCNDLVFNKLKAHLGVFFKSNISFKGLVSPDYAVYKNKAYIKNMKVLELLFRHPLYIEQFIIRATGIVEGLIRLYTNDLFDIAIPIAPENEQIGIIEYIETQSKQYEKLITVQQQQIQKLKEYKTTLINNAVTGKIKIPLATQQGIK